MIGPLAKRWQTLSAAALLAPLLAACATSSELQTSARFDAASDKAIVVLGTNLRWFEGHEQADPSLTTHWQEYDPDTLRLVPDGKMFWTQLRQAVWDEGSSSVQFMKVMEVEPGDYALVAAGSHQRKSVFVRLKNGKKSATATSYVIYPERFIDPQAPVEPRKNFLFSVAPGQVVYIGDFEFIRPHRHLEMIVAIDYSLEEAAARAALAAYPGVTGRPVILDLSVPTQQVAR